jgi:hypothetical protein
MSRKQLPPPVGYRLHRHMGRNSDTHVQYVLRGMQSLASELTPARLRRIYVHSDMTGFGDSSYVEESARAYSCASQSVSHEVTPYSVNYPMLKSWSNLIQRFPTWPRIKLRHMSCQAMEIHIKSLVTTQDGQVESIILYDLTAKIVM